MHPLSSAAAYQQSMQAAGYGAVPGMDGGGGQPSPSVEGAGSPHGPDGTGGPADHQNGSGGGANYNDINQLLDQILNITEQSLDEAQVSLTTN